MGHIKESAYSQQDYVDQFVRTDILSGMFRSMSQFVQNGQVTPLLKSMSLLRQFALKNLTKQNPK